MGSSSIVVYCSPASMSNCFLFMECRFTIFALRRLSAIIVFSHYVLLSVRRIWRDNKNLPCVVSVVFGWVLV